MNVITIVMLILWFGIDFLSGVEPLHWLLSMIAPLLLVGFFRLYFDLLIRRKSEEEIHGIRYLESLDRDFSMQNLFHTAIKINWYVLIGAIILALDLIFAWVWVIWGSAPPVAMDYLGMMASVLSLFAYAFMGYLLLKGSSIPRMGFRVGFICALCMNAASPAIDGLIFATKMHAVS